MLLGVDVGGTFTDAALIAGDRLVTAKAPTTPADQSEGVIDAVEAALAEAGAQPGDVERFVHGMTVGTNALLEGTVARTALLATEGFTDLEELGRQARPELYRLCVGHPPPLVPPSCACPCPSACGPDGVLRELDEDALRARARRRCPTTSRRSRSACCGASATRTTSGARPSWPRERARGVHVSTSHETAGVFREYERCATTVVDAALSPLLRRYLERLAERAGEAGLPEPEVMLSSGGVATPPPPRATARGRCCRARRAARWARRRREAARRTPSGSTWAARRATCRWSLGGRVASTGGREVGGRALALPMVDVHTVGAGGGSIAWRDAGGALRVGPRSAGADPGPACYGRGGERADGDRREPAAGLPRRRLAAGRRGGARRDAAERAVGALAGELGLSADGDRRRDRARGRARRWPAPCGS